MVVTAPNRSCFPWGSAAGQTGTPRSGLPQTEVGPAVSVRADDREFHAVSPRWHSLWRAYSVDSTLRKTERRVLHPARASVGSRSSFAGNILLYLRICRSSGFLPKCPDVGVVEKTPLLRRFGDRLAGLEQAVEFGQGEGFEHGFPAFEAGVLAVISKGGDFWTVKAMILPGVEDEGSARLEVLRVPGHDVQAVPEGRRREEAVGRGG